MAFTKPVNTINGFINLGTVMRAAGYTGNGHVSKLLIFNPQASDLIYVHLTENSTTAPTTKTDGIPVGAGSTAIGTSLSIDTAIDITSVYIAATGVVAIKVAAAGY